MNGLGIVLSGGGSRGAYEVGVLSYVFHDIVGARTAPPKVGVISGTSVGAVNGAFLASTAEDFAHGVRRLEDLWRQLRLADVMSFGIRQAAGLHRVVLGGRRPTGVFDAAPLVRLVGEGIHWRQLGRNLRTGALKALTISATNVPTGRPTVFIDRHPGVELPRHLPAQVAVRGVRIGPAHVLASAAIPMVFPPVRIGRQLHCDGGLRLNTPMSPAIHLGASRLFVIGVSDPGDPETPALPDDRYPGAPFLLGKVLNAFLLDHLNADLEELERINADLRDGLRAFGPEYLDRINAEAIRRDAAPKRIVPALAVRPSVDLGQIASEHLKTYKRRANAALGRQFLRFLDVGQGGDADLASYLLFDGGYADALIDLGRQDAHAMRDEIEAFLYAEG
ncbi:MAG TPA: patatin-like phospholipase family protein [Polyangiaceae bacterium LLY-WYZ-15_(1-7)]|nr:patatin-like phospholipase family protein [Polyangiaceae bacterium LLY-WYZ-15_(1-7)]HJL00905.1 patatin-like phospholipase family protein [Polyangiaceae bacterium LLY-WYZ-15_(1-7)]HJL12884.1 patatin-like phospholipase family protein [Polyangiaceae bacterium LLY-WYZ-15_(1-7)]HJL25421.1 patatin-like phospholipase family protein [Polyangiaceae bacterium LLY-WYZ-15_(1-7)]HJL31278.1 patatin-like phospholipase family protein [Polyangiaceae bacterium LLY-WYZ-15_(1-7)]